MLVVANDIAELRRMSAWLVGEARALGVPAPVVDDLEVCANEAVTNVINYGFEGGRRHEIALRIAVDARQVSLQIEDDGRPFNPLDLPERPDPPSLREAPVGGFGVRLIRRLMPASRYERRGGRNVLTLSTAIG